MRPSPAALLRLLWCAVTITITTTSADPAAGPAEGWQGSDADGDGNFLVSPDAQADFVVPAGFEVRDLTREAHRIPGEPARYLILSSRVVRPGHPYRLSVNVLRSRQPIRVRAALYRDSVRLSSLQRDCTQENMELFEIPVPANSGPGQYRLHVEGNELDQLEGSLFRNRTDLRFEARSLTMLVQMDSPVYRQLQTVRFRLVLLGTDLKSFKSSADVYLLDPNGIVMKRWMSRQSNTGLVSAEYPLGERPVAGSWKVRVTARGQTEEQPFLVELYQPPKFEVLVETPAMLRTSDPDLHVTVSADYSAGGGAVTGLLTLLAEASPLHRRPGWRAHQVVLETTNSFSGRHQTSVPMSRLIKLLQPLDGSEVKVTAQLVDSQLQVTGQGHSTTRVYGDTIHLKFLGGPSQVFRAHMPFRAHLVAHMTDGSRLSPERLIRHRLDVQPELVFRDGKRYKMSKRRAQMSPNHPGVWEVEVILYEERDFSQRMDHVRYLRLTASLKDYYGKVARAETVAAAVHTPSNLHLHLATSTHFPRVDEFLVLHVRCNFFIENFRYVVFSKGILLDHGLVKMQVPLHTFPVPVTPQMAPEATILIYHLTWYGQIVSDTLRFPVSGLSRNNFTISVSRTNHDHRPPYEVEVAVKGRQGATVGLAAFQSHLYQVTSGTDVSSSKLLRAMQKFDDSASSGEFAHQWTTVDGRPGPTVHLASHRTAFGFNETLEDSELLVLTDAGVPPRPPPPPCTLDGRRACRAGGCYLATSRCDGQPDCDDMSDENGCNRNLAETNSDEFLLRRRSRVLSDFTPTWLWSDVTIGKYSHVILRAAGPNVTSQWTVSSIGVGEHNGLGYVHTAAKYSVVRQLEAAASLPTSCVLGEQLGLVVTLRSRGNNSITVNLVLAKSPLYRFVSLGEFGKQVSSVRRSEDALVEHRTSVPLAPRQTRSVTLPVEPLATGAVIVTLYTEHQGVKHFLRRTVNVRLPGVPAAHHTALLVDVTSRPNLYTFLDVPRPHLLVPGSYRATVSLTGGVVGPWPEPEDLPAAPRTADATLCELLMTLYEMTYLKPERPRADTLMRRLSRAYQNLLAFRRTDGGFSLYSGDQPANIWMTAHAALALAKLRLSPRRQRSLLDVKVLSSAARWLLSAQQNSGLFRENTLAADQRYNDTGDVMLTSHALLALTEVARAAEKTDTKDDDSETQETLDIPGLAEGLSSAADLLAVRVQGSLSRLQAAMAALALAGRGGRPASDAREQLSRQLRDEGEFMYWSREAHPLPAYRVDNHVPYLQPRRTFSHESENVLTTALALRAYVALDQHRMEPIVNWLQARRATDYGWIGYMDTLAVTEALLEYSAARHVRENTDMQMNVETAAGRDSLHTHAEAEGTRQELEITDPSEGLKLRLTGSGIAVAQLSVQYRLFALREEGDIQLEVDAGHHSPNSSHVTIGLCVRLSDMAKRPVSGAVAVLADVPSGYGVSASTLRQYVHSGLVPGLVAAELTPSHRLQLVFSSVTGSPVCARLTVVRWFVVANTSRSLSASAYPLHEPERRSSVMFDVSQLSRYGLCDLCGSYQCGGCSAPSRTNTGASTSAPAALLLLLPLLLLPPLPRRVWR